MKYYLGPDYMRFNADVTHPVRYAQIWVIDDKETYCHSEYCAKGYNGQSIEE